MKVSIKQKALMTALEKGAVATTSNEAQADSSNLSVLVRSIKITADKHFTIESSTNMISSKYTVAVNDENGITVNEGGSVMVPASEMINWVKLQNPDAVIALNLQKLDKPILIQPQSIEDVEVTSVKKTGILKMTSKDPMKTNSKWELDAFDVESIKSVNYKEKSAKKCFDVKARALKEGLSKVSFAALAKDYEQTYNCVSFQFWDGKAFLQTTDTKHCALYQIPKDDISDIDGSATMLLIPSSVLELAVKISDDENSLSFSYHQDKSNNPRIFISQPGLEIRLAGADEDKKASYHSGKLLVDRDSTFLAEIPKISLEKVLMITSIVNKVSVLFTFRKEDKNLVIKAISEESKYAPLMEKISIPELTKDARFVCSPNHLLEALKVIKSDEIKVSIANNQKNTLMIGKDDPNFYHFDILKDSPIYKDAKEV